MRTKYFLLMFYDIFHLPKVMLLHATKTIAYLVLPWLLFPAFVLADLVFIASKREPFAIGLLVGRKVLVGRRVVDRTKTKDA